MKKTFTTLAMLITISAFSHHIDKLELKSTGIAPAIITLDSTYTAEMIYKRAKEWVQYNYKNPSEVLKADIENTSIRIVGYDPAGWEWTQMGDHVWGLTYTLEIDIKDGRYRLSYSVDKLWCGSSPCLYNTDMFFKEDGSQRKVYNTAVPSINTTMNTLNLSLYKYITGETQAKKNDW